MLRILTFRLIAALIGLSAGLAAPATALAHGLQHARVAHEHAHEHEHHRSEQHDHGPTDSSGPGALTAPAGGDHPHPRIEGAPTVRADAWVALAVVAAVAVLVLPDETAEPPTVFLDQFPGPDPPTGSPPRLRAPPVR